MIDYEKIAEGVVMPGSEPQAAPAPPRESFDTNTVFESAEDPAAAQARANKVYLPVNHEKYQGIGEAKGYAQGDDFSGNRLKRTRYNHEAMIDVIIAEPTITQNELAQRFDRSVNWVSIMINSDAFQAALAKRRDDILDPFLVASVEERLRSLANQSLQVIADKLQTTQNPDLAIKALEISTKALGFGARNPGSGVVNNSFVVQLPPKIASAAEWAGSHGPGRVIDQ